MKRFKYILCVFLSVLMLFFSINNSYFSPHKMDNVQAASIVLGGGVVITLEMVIEVLCAIAIAGLSVGLVVEWLDMDIETMLQDFHDWLADNVDILDTISIDGTSALKEWSQTDEWEVIIGGGSSDPNPSPDLESNFPYKTVSLTTLGAAVELGYNGIKEAVNKVVSMDSGFIDLAREYINDKIETFQDAELKYDEAGTPLDPISSALKYRYSNQSPNNAICYDGNYSVINGEYIYKIYSTASWTSDAGQVYDYIYYNKNEEAFTSKYQIAGYYEISDYWKGNIIKTYCNSNSKILEYNNNCVYDLWIDGIQKKFGDYLVSGTSNYCNYFYTSGGYSVNFPVFSSYDEMAAFLRGEIDDSGCINISRPNNYIDSNDDYGWASTATFSPSDLAALNPDLAEKLSGHDFSLNSLVTAINALKSQLEEQNPNVAPDVAPDADPLPYPDNATYADIYEQVVTDPDIFPESNPSTDTEPGANPEPDTEPEPGTNLDYSNFLQTIIDILQNILNLLKEFFAWFIIDFAAIKAHLLSALTSIPAFEEFNPILDYIDYFRSSIGDSYEYPVISVNTPDILLPYYKDAVIILVDFKDYAKYFVWVRAFLSFSIYFGFGLWLINDIRKFFSGL